MLHAAASTYGSKHYRGILAMHSLRKAGPVLLVLVAFAGLFGLGYLLLPAVDATVAHPGMAGGVVVLGLVLIAVGFWGVRRARSPYRRRHFR